MLLVYNCVAHQHDLRLVAVAALIAILGSHTAISLLRHVAAQDRSRMHWLLGAALAGGCAIWGAHFVAMLAYAPLIETGYSVSLTAVSLLEAILLTGCGLALAVSGRRTIDRALGGAVVGGAISIMHYTGMYAADFPSSFVWNRPYVVASVVLGCGLASGAVTCAVRYDKRFSRLAATALLTLAICATHFIGMAATSIQLSGAHSTGSQVLSPGLLAVGVAAATGVIVLLGLAALMLDRRAARRREAENTNLRDLADIAFEGLVICDGSVVVAANKSFERMIKSSSAALAGSDFESFFETVPPPGSVDLQLHNVDDRMLRAPGGTDIPVEVLRKPIIYAGRPHQVIAVRDLRERRKAEAQIRHLAHHDPLTGLYNRASFSAGLARRIAEGSETRPFALLALDLDHFKSVNDRFGHPIGDALLITVADQLRACVRATDIIGRLGGDEFAIVLAGPITPGGVSATAERLVDAISAPYLLGEIPIRIGVSIGITMAPATISSAELLMKNADMALYQAKARGRSMSCFFQPEAIQAADG